METELQGRDLQTKFKNKKHVIKVQWSTIISIQWGRLFINNALIIILLKCFLVEIKIEIESLLQCIGIYEDDWRISKLNDKGKRF